MNVCVYGLWHLGSVTAACLASLGHQVVGLDPNQKVINDLNQGKAPIFEPNLDPLLATGQQIGHLRFTTILPNALDNVEVLWVTFDTPVDEDDQADIDYVIEQIKLTLPHVANGTIVLISSQLPVGSIRKLELFAHDHLKTKFLQFACCPENLRLGKALNVFLNPDRLVVGVRTNEVRCALEPLLLTISDNIEWMSVESAEMTKHAINAFLATSVTFANEIATICERVGADAKEVERGLKSEIRIGQKAYLSPGEAFAGGTLARDIEFLGMKSGDHNLPTPLLSSIKKSNDEHKNWVRRKLLENIGNFKDVAVAIWGLTYKEGTNTLRRSLSVELCDWLIEQGAILQVFDPLVTTLPERWKTRVRQCKKPLDAIDEASALVIGMQWPDMRQQAAEILATNRQNLILIDANRYLQSISLPVGVQYIAVGTPDITHSLKPVY
jgi:UDPglucose 6-dehydrogenase